MASATVKPTIHDGAPGHRNAESPADHIHLHMLPPYSPFLNIVEQAISALKAAIKNDISRPEIQQEMQNRRRAREDNIPLGEYRKRILHAAAKKNLGSITVAKSVAWFRHMQTPATLHEWRIYCWLNLLHVIKRVIDNPVGIVEFTFCLINIVYLLH